MSNIIFVDFARGAPRRIPASAAAAPGVIPLPPARPGPALPATASLAQIVVQLRAGARDAQTALLQMRAGSAELIRLSTAMKQQTGALAGQINVVSAALTDFGAAVRKMHDARSQPVVH